jgi:hypothetical protein
MSVAGSPFPVGMSTHPENGSTEEQSNTSANTVTRSPLLNPLLPHKILNYLPSCSFPAPLVSYNPDPAHPFTDEAKAISLHKVNRKTTAEACVVHSLGDIVEFPETGMLLRSNDTVISKSFSRLLYLI